jgi:hypothetical protein
MMLSGYSHFRARSKIIRQENDLSDDDRQQRRDQITAERKAWIKKDAFKDSSQAGPGAPAANQSIPEYDD